MTYFIKFLSIAILASNIGHVTFAKSKKSKIVPSELPSYILSYPEFKKLSKKRQIKYFKYVRNKIKKIEMRQQRSGTKYGWLDWMMDEAVALPKGLNKKCLFAGHVSKIYEHTTGEGDKKKTRYKCQRPGNGSCPYDQIECNPALFGKGVCLQTKKEISFATNTCFKKSKDKSLEDIINEVGPEEWAELVAGVNNYCGDKNLHWNDKKPCAQLTARVEKMEATLEKVKTKVANSCKACTVVYALTSHEAKKGKGLGQVSPTKCDFTYSLNDDGHLVSTGEMSWKRSNLGFDVDGTHLNSEALYTKYFNGVLPDFKTPFRKSSDGDNYVWRTSDNPKYKAKVHTKIVFNPKRCEFTAWNYIPASKETIEKDAYGLAFEEATFFNSRGFMREPSDAEIVLHNEISQAVSEQTDCPMGKENGFYMLVGSGGHVPKWSNWNVDKNPIAKLEDFAKEAGPKFISDKATNKDRVAYIYSSKDDSLMRKIPITEKFEVETPQEMADKARAEAVRVAGLACQPETKEGGSKDPHTGR